MPDPKTTPKFRNETAELYRKVEHCVSASGRPVSIDLLLLTHIDQALKEAYERGKEEATDGDAAWAAGYQGAVNDRV